MSKSLSAIYEVASYPDGVVYLNNSMSTFSVIYTVLQNGTGPRVLDYILKKKPMKILDRFICFVSLGPGLKETPKSPILTPKMLNIMLLNIYSTLLECVKVIT